MVNYPKGLRSLTQLAALAASALIIGCTTGHLSEERYGRLTRLDERVVKGIGMVLYGPQPLTFGPQRIVVTLSVGSRVAMSNVSAIWLMYRPPGSAVQHTVRMFPVGDYIDAFGAVVPFTETGPLGPEYSSLQSVQRSREVDVWYFVLRRRYQPRNHKNTIVKYVDGLICPVLLAA